MVLEGAVRATTLPFLLRVVSHGFLLVLLVLDRPLAVLVRAEFGAGVVGRLLVCQLEIQLLLKIFENLLDVFELRALVREVILEHEVHALVELCELLHQFLAEIVADLHHGRKGHGQSLFGDRKRIVGLGHQLEYGAQIKRNLGGVAKGLRLQLLEGLLQRQFLDGSTRVDGELLGLPGGAVVRGTIHQVLK